MLVREKREGMKEESVCPSNVRGVRINTECTDKLFILSDIDGRSSTVFLSRASQR